jgi:fatty acid desaturase
MKLPGGVYVRILISAGLGVGYGLWGLEAASPLAIPLILWAAMVLLLVWRMPPKPGVFVACVCAYVMGFGAVGHLYWAKYWPHANHRPAKPLTQRQTSSMPPLCFFLYWLLDRP